MLVPQHKDFGNASLLEGLLKKDSRDQVLILILSLASYDLGWGGK